MKKDKSVIQHIEGRGIREMIVENLKGILPLETVSQLDMSI